jgi:antitoxin component of MazEF toxin-antitoxin module
MLPVMLTRYAKLTSVGDELALVLDQETLYSVGYTVDTVVDVRVENGSIVIEPIRDAEAGDLPPPPDRSPDA